MADEPRISVLMGVYNDETFLASAIESILSQTYDDFEFIIVNDASTDNTDSILSSFDDSRITVLENETNRGLTVSLNRALEEADGKYIARQDADDLSKPNRFDKQVSFLEANDDVAVVGTGAELINADNEVISRRIGYCNPSFEGFLKKSHLVHGSIMARQSVLQSVGGYNEFFRYGQDYDLWLRLAKKYELANVPEPLYRLRIHDESVYFSQKDESALYSMLARHLATGDADRTLLTELEEITDYYDYLNDEQKATLHHDLATRYLRYGHVNPARKECRRAREYTGRTVKTELFELLARAGPTAVAAVRWGMRRYLNVRTRIANRLDCPYFVPDHRW